MGDFDKPEKSNTCCNSFFRLQDYINKSQAISPGPFVDTNLKKLSELKAFPTFKKAWEDPSCE